MCVNPAATNPLTCADHLIANTRSPRPKCSAATVKDQGAPAPASEVTKLTNVAAAAMFLQAFNMMALMNALAWCIEGSDEAAAAKPACPGSGGG